MRRITIRKGLQFKHQGLPEQSIGLAVEHSKAVKHVAFRGLDFPGLQPEFEIDVNETVECGQTLFRDRANPEVNFTAPVSGVIKKIETAHRRTLDIVTISADPDLTSIEFQIPEDLTSREAARSLLLKSGLWTSFRTRPFNRIPDPDTSPAHIFVSAIDTEPLCADPRIVLNDVLGHFRRALELLGHLTNGNVYVCQSPGEPIAQSQNARVIDVAFSGKHPAGLPGTHIHVLSPVGRRKQVWHISYQDVAAIGHLAEYGVLDATRVIALAGSGIRSPRLIRVPMGANLNELTQHDTTSNDVSILSGSSVSGRSDLWLGHYHRQVTVNQQVTPSTSIQQWPIKLMQRYFKPNTAIVAEPWLDSVSPLTTLMAPLLRSIATGDLETAEAAGCLAFSPDDIAPISQVCPTGHDYAALLSRCLTELQEQTQSTADVQT